MIGSCNDSELTQRTGSRDSKSLEKSHLLCSPPPLCVCTYVCPFVTRCMLGGYVIDNIIDVM